MVAVAVEVDERALGVGLCVEPADLEPNRRAPASAGLVAVAEVQRAAGLGARPPGPLGVGHRELAEVRQQPAAVVGRDRLRMELDAPERALAVGDAHQHAVAGPGDRLELLRRRLRDAERVVADDLELARDPGEQRRVLVHAGAQAAVHRLGRVLDAPVREPADPLVAEADAEQRHRGVGDRVGGHAEVVGVVRAPGTGRDDDVVEVQLVDDLVPGRLVVAQDDRLVAVRLGQQLEEVVGERVVVVDQEGLHVTPGTCAAPSRAGSSESRRGTRARAGPCSWRAARGSTRPARAARTRRSAPGRP